MDSTNQIISYQLASAPEAVRSYIAQKRWQTVIDEIARKNNFSEDQKISLANEVLIVLIGLDLDSNLKSNIQTTLSLPEIITRDIAAEIKEKIFKEVQEFLPKEMEGEPAQMPINKNKIGQPSRLIEDAPGNKDNVLPPLKQKFEPKQVPLPPQNLPIKQTPLEQKIAPQVEVRSADTEWQARKEIAGTNTIIEKKYSGGDPYREPLK
jgi:hypothetical protein